jgi:dephospho-CoA kinase
LAGTLDCGGVPILDFGFWITALGKKPIIGILGGICSGKSAAAAEFGKLGCAVIDADKMAKRLLGEPTIQPKILSFFGKDILDPTGKIDRQKLAEIVFADQSKKQIVKGKKEEEKDMGETPMLRPLQALTEIIHPPVLEETEALIKKYMADPNILAIVLDMPLLAEVGWEKRCNSLVFVDCDSKIRLERAGNRGIKDENQLKVRENFQISLDKKRQISDYSIYNNFDLSELAQQVSSIFNCIMKNA